MIPGAVRPAPSASHRPAAAAPAPSPAKARTTPPHSSAPDPDGPVFARLDANHDGVLARAGGRIGATSRLSRRRALAL
jgi:hypothetical protein